MIDELIQAISQYPNGTYMQLSWPHEGVTLGCVLDTIYETDNGKLEGTSLYKEYYACAFRIKRVIENANNGAYPTGSLMEIYRDTAPTYIVLETGEMVWPRQ